MVTEKYFAVSKDPVRRGKESTELVAPFGHFEKEKRDAAEGLVDKESDAIKLPNTRPVAVGRGEGSILPEPIITTGFVAGAFTLSKEYVAVNCANPMFTNITAQNKVIFLIMIFRFKIYLDAKFNNFLN